MSLAIVSVCFWNDYGLCVLYPLFSFQGSSLRCRSEYYFIKSSFSCQALFSFFSNSFSVLFDLFCLSAKIILPLPTPLVNVFLLKHSPLAVLIFCCFRSARWQRQLFIIHTSGNLSTPFFNIFRLFFYSPFIMEKRPFPEVSLRKKPLFSFRTA